MQTDKGKHHLKDLLQAARGMLGAYELRLKWFLAAARRVAPAIPSRMAAFEKTNPFRCLKTPAGFGDEGVVGLLLLVGLYFVLVCVETGGALTFFGAGAG
jgi:hypothetical protein